MIVDGWGVGVEEYTTEFDQIAAGAAGNKYITAIATIIFLYVYFNLPPPPAVICICWQ